MNCDGTEGKSVLLCRGELEMEILETFLTAICYSFVRCVKLKE